MKELRSLKKWREILKADFEKAAEKLAAEKKAKEAATRNIQLIYRWLQPIQPTLNRLTAQWSPD